MNLNKVFVLGNVTRDVEVKALPSGQSVVNFGVATNRFYTDSSGEKKQDAEFHNIVAFGKLADIISRYLKKGALVLVEGRLKTRSWQDTSNITHYKTEIIAQNIQLPPKSWSGGGTAENNSDRKQQKIKEDNIPIIEENSESENEINVEDIPF